MSRPDFFPQFILSSRIFTTFLTGGPLRLRVWFLIILKNLNHHGFTLDILLLHAVHGCGGHFHRSLRIEQYHAFLPTHPNTNMVHDSFSYRRTL